MIIELRKKTIADEVWYYTYVDDKIDRSFLDPDKAEKHYNDLVDNAKNPPVIEVIKSVEINKPMDLTKVSNLEFEDVDHKDYPDYCDAFISSADYDGEPMTEAELDELNKDSEFVHEKLIDHLN